MSIYWLQTHTDAVVAGVNWSETTKPRIPASNLERWFATDADRAPLGPFPQEILAKINAHWALSLGKMDSPPDTIGRLKSAHFTGAPFARRHICDVFEMYSEGNCQIVPIKKLWSLKDDAEVTELYFVANVYNAAPVIDLDKTEVREVKNPKMGHPFSPASRSLNKMFVRKESFEGHHLLRDAATSVWFCDDVFREAIENATPGTYAFRDINIV
ncbi:MULTISPECIES: imm11 family protein [unclassified Roseovarius]|uniref:imm11 family protein n=1 Tax=unclassified Roseovarius TaxID=2614913 RepID=UPI00273D40C3|nr:DUF1629 domain-containing protein [Roseovarius sp. MMSF_3350]